jgi:hypothetical protein
VRRHGGPSAHTKIVRMWDQSADTTSTTICRHHLVVSSNGSGVEFSGAQSIETTQPKLSVLTTCPAATDASGVHFTPMDGDFCGSERSDMPWFDYLKLYAVNLPQCVARFVDCVSSWGLTLQPCILGRFRAYIVLVRETGTFWTELSAFRDIATLVDKTPFLCTEFFTCVVDGGDCAEFERIAAEIVDENLIIAHRRTTRSRFPDLGNSSGAGSLSQTAKDLVVFDFSTSPGTTDSNKTAWTRSAGFVVMVVALVLVAMGIVVCIVVVCRKRDQRQSEQSKSVDVHVIPGIPSPDGAPAGTPVTARLSLV